MAESKKIETKVVEEPTDVAGEEQPSPQLEGPPTPPAQSPGQWFNSYFGSDWVTKAKEQVSILVFSKCIPTFRL
jgi:hypothetical protein